MILALGDISTPFATYLLDKGVEFALLRNSRAHRKMPIDKGQLAHYSEVDFENFENVISEVRELPFEVDAVVTDYENYILPVSKVVDALNINGLPLGAAEKVTDKGLMREAFLKYDPTISPAFQEVSSEESLKLFASKYSFPMIIKPANLVKSLYVTKVNDEIELLEAFRKMEKELPGTYQKLNIHHEPKIIVEEFLEGSIHSIDGVTDHEGNIHLIDSVVDILSGYEVGHDDNYHFSRTIPSALPQYDQAAIKKVAEKGVKALGLRSSASHIELFLTKNGPKIIEIGARTGGYRSRMHREANGIDYYGSLIDVLLKKPVDLSIKKRDYVTTIEIFPDKSGAYNSLKGYEELKLRPSFATCALLAEKGQEVGLARNGFKASARITLVSNDEAAFQEDFAFVRNKVSVKLQ